MGSSLIDSPLSTDVGGADVRRDEWYSISMLKDLKNQMREKEERAQFSDKANALRNELTQQQHELDDAWKAHQEQERNEARRQDRRLRVRMDAYNET